MEIIHEEEKPSNLRDSTKHGVSSLIPKEHSANDSDGDGRMGNGTSACDFQAEQYEVGEHAGGTVISDEDREYVVSFDGDHDPMSPRSMPPLRKWIIIIIVCTATLCVTCASSIYTTTYAQMNPEFGTSPTIATLGLSIFVLGIAVGPLATGPLSEWYGRRPIYLVSWSFFMIWTITVAVARNNQTMITVRFLSGLAGGTFLAVSGGTVADIFARHEIEIPMILVSTSPFLGACLGPPIGGFISSFTNWRWNHYLMIIWAAIILLSVIFCAPETYHPIRLRTKAEYLRKQTGNCRYRAASMGTDRTSKSQALAISLLRPFQLIFLEPMCLALDVYSAVLLGLIYLFFRSFPLLFGTIYNFDLWQVGLSFLGIISGMIIAATVILLWTKAGERVVLTKKETIDQSQPEQRLTSAIPGGVLIPVGLFWFGWTMRPEIHWIVPIIGSSIFGCGTILVFTGIFTFLVDAYPQYAASALAGNGFLRASFAAAFPFFSIQLYEGLGFYWATSLLAFVTTAMVPLPWIFIKYGGVLRGRSKFAIHTRDK